MYKSRTARLPDAVQDLIAAHAERPGGLLPLLHAIQEACGFIPPDAVPLIAQALNQSRAEVHGVISFYHHFRTSPPATHYVTLCCGEACLSMGARQLVAHAERTLTCPLNSTSANRTFSLDAVYCLGQCATAPAAMIDGELHARVTTERFDALIAHAREGA